MTYRCQYRHCGAEVGRVAGIETMSQTGLILCPKHFVEVRQERRERRKLDARRKLYDGVSDYPKLQEALDTAWNTLDAHQGRQGGI